MPIWWFMVLGLQAATGSPSPIARPRLAGPTEALRCDENTPGEVVVCGALDWEAFRLRASPERYVAKEGLPNAETTLLSRARIAAETEQGQALGGGAPPRAMVRLKLPF